MILSSGSITSPFPEMVKDVSLSATTSSASRFLNILSVLQSLANSTAERVKIPLCLSSFASNFSNKVKNYQLAKKALKHLNKKIHLIELVGYNRDEVNILLNAVDFLLMTSISEGSHQIIKEAMA